MSLRQILLFCNFLSLGWDSLFRRPNELVWLELRRLSSDTARGSRRGTKWHHLFLLIFQISGKMTRFTSFCLIVIEYDIELLIQLAHSIDLWDELIDKIGDLSVVSSLNLDRQFSLRFFWSMNWLDHSRFDLDCPALLMLNLFLIFWIVLDNIIGRKMLGVGKYIVRVKLGEHAGVVLRIQVCLGSTHFLNHATRDHWIPTSKFVMFYIYQGLIVGFQFAAKVLLLCICVLNLLRRDHVFELTDIWERCQGILNFLGWRLLLLIWPKTLIHLFGEVGSDRFRWPNKLGRIIFVFHRQRKVAVVQVTEDIYNVRRQASCLDCSLPTFALRLSFMELAGGLSSWLIKLVFRQRHILVCKLLGVKLLRECCLYLIAFLKP